MKAVILARVSTKEQEDGHSLKAQLANLHLYAERKNLEIIREYKVIESSTKGGRPEFMRMLDFIKKQKEKIAVVADTVDRFQRSFREMPVLLDLLDKDQAEFHFVKEGNVLTKDSNSMEKAMWGIGVVMAQSYTDQLSDNVKRSVKHKIANGEWPGPAPLGYLNSIDTLTGKKTIILDPERHYLVKRVFEEYATGAYSLAELARNAKDWGLRTRKGKIVSHQTLHTLIQKPFYYGMMFIRGEFYPHVYEPLISKELFDSCEAVRTGRGRTQAASETKYPFILRGLMTCAVSGRKVNCDIKKGKHIYVISRDPANPDKKIWTNENLVLEQIRDVFKSIQILPALLTEILDELKKTHKSEQEFHHTSIKSLNKENELVTKRLDSLMEKFLDESITKDMYNRTHSQLIKRRQEIQEALENHHAGDEQFRIAVTTLVTLASKAAELFDRSQTDEKRQLIGYLFANLQMEGGKVRYSLKKPFNLLQDLGDYKEWLLGQDSNLRPIG